MIDLLNMPQQPNDEEINLNFVCKKIRNYECHFLLDYSQYLFYQLYLVIYFQLFS